MAKHRNSISTYEWATTEAIDQEPGDERSQEEPGVQETSHEPRSVGVKSETGLEQSAGVICSIVSIGQPLLSNAFQLTNQGIDATKLLEDLDTASDEESSARVDDCGKLSASYKL